MGEKDVRQRTVDSEWLHQLSHGNWPIRTDAMDEVGFLEGASGLHCAQLLRLCPTYCLEARRPP